MTGRFPFSVPMTKLIPPKIIIPLVLLFGVLLVGCSHQKTKRGHLFRGDWAVEYNRTPWIGCPPDSGYDDEETEKHGLFSCLAKDGDDRNRKKFRHHCALNNDCSAKEPCCRTLGCGMWVDPNDPTNAALGGAARACGLLPFCTPQKPCCLTPNCGRPANVNINPQTLLANQSAGMPGRNSLTPNGVATVRGMNPTGLTPNGMTPNGMNTNGGLSSGTIGVMPNGTIGTISGGAVGTVPGVTLVSRGIVPGASAITSGGMVAAIGVATPAGMMTPTGVRMPNGAINNAIVLRACVMTPNCTAARPCGLTPNCGGPVAVNTVATNATVLASALQAQGVANGVMQMNSMGTMVNPMTNQPINGTTMGGYPQAGYPPIGYAPSGYAPGYPRYAAGMTGMALPGEEEMYEDDEEEYDIALPETRSSMPVPRFQTIPHKPAFQRSEGMPRETPAKPTTTAMTSRNAMSDKELESALDQAYLEGVSAAMDDLEKKLEVKRQAAAKAQLQEKILQQAEYVQQQLDTQEELRVLAMQRERQLRQQALRQAEATVEVAAAPPRLPPPNTVAATKNNPRATPVSIAKPESNVNPAQLAGNLKTSVVNGVNGVFAPLLSYQQATPKGESPATSQTRLNPTQPKAKAEVAAVQQDVPVRPPVSPKVPKYGLADEEEESLIMQAQFTEDDKPMRP